MEGLHIAAEWAADHPVATVAAVGGGVLLVAPLAVATPVLAAVGFGSQGVVAGM